MSNRQGNLALATGICCGGNSSKRPDNARLETSKAGGVFDSSQGRSNLAEKTTPEKLRIMRLLQSVVTDII